MADRLVVVVGRDYEGKRRLVQYLRDIGYGGTVLSRRMRSAKRRQEAGAECVRGRRNSVADYGWSHCGRENVELLHAMGVVVVCVGNEPWPMQTYQDSFCMPHAVFQGVDDEALKEFERALDGGQFDLRLGLVQSAFGPERRTAGYGHDDVVLPAYTAPALGEVLVPRPGGGSVPLAQWWAEVAARGPSPHTPIPASLLAPSGSVRVPIGGGETIPMEQWAAQRGLTPDRTGAR